ncbi:arylamine N-acetyltransferase [Mesorhizobium sp. ZMM04-5]|uniref:Arylamine N-acetyltransferase n=1 Tax=Mesorhizobium marinum TaxID=3228790 RepID=A0ABV3QU22_9HYPH
MTFELGAYLNRLGLTGADPTSDRLDDLLKAQMSAIPFENVDPFLGSMPDLDHDAIWRKLVVERRGGYCLELNTLLGNALDALGVAKRAVLGRVRMGAPVGGPRSHLAWIVTAGGRDVLMDAGFGGPGAHGVVPLNPDVPHRVGARTFRIRGDDATGELVLERQESDGWLSLYGFDGAPVTDADIEASNVVCSRWHKSPFPSHLMLNLHRAGGRVSLFDRQVSVETPNGTKKWTVESLNALRDCLGDLFRLDLDEAVLAPTWSKLNAIGMATMRDHADGALAS